MPNFKSELTNEPQRIKRLRRLAKMLDSAYSIPGTKIQFGWDSIIGFVPIVGDSATFALSLFVLREAWFLKVSWWTFIKMSLNVAIDLLIGAIPVVGDLFDVVWKANERNMRLLAPYLQKDKAV